MSWHDNRVHAMRMIEGEHGVGELWLDLDYILEWIEQQKTFRFRVVPVWLKFKEVAYLKLALDYPSVSAATCPFSIESIQKQHVQRERYTACVWSIAVNWPAGEIRFEASGFDQVAYGAEVLSTSQGLRPHERGVA